MQIKTSELIDDALDWAVYESQGYGKNYLKFWNEGGDKRFVHCHVMSSPSKNWEQGGPIMDNNRIIFDYRIHPADENDKVFARLSKAKLKPEGQINWYAPKNGPTPLVAAMRCYVASKFGDTIEVPDELTQV